MKHLVWIPVALLAGLLLGRWAPQVDLRQARQELAELRARAPGRAGGHAALAGVHSLFQAAELDAKKTRRPDRPRAAAPASNAAPEKAAPAAAATDAGGSNAVPVVDTNTWEKVKQAWSLRAEIAKTNFLARARLNEQQAMDLTVLVEAMNLRLGAAFDRLAGQIRTRDDLAPETGLRALNELSGVLVMTYDELDRKLPEGWRERAGSEFDLVDFVDPDVVTPMVDLEEVVHRPAPRHPPPAGSVEFRMERRTVRP